VCTSVNSALEVFFNAVHYINLTYLLVYMCQDREGEAGVGTTSSHDGRRTTTGTETESKARH